ncbi:MAG: hypothetical protein V4611_04195 [Patescibacteria group bacterium]
MVSKPYDIESTEIRISSKADIHTVLQAASDLAKELGGNTTVSFLFNGRTIRVRPDTDTSLIIREFWRPPNITGQTIGPYPNPIELEIDKELALERGGTIIVDIGR